MSSSALGCPWPKRDGSVRARLFLIVDDHSRLIVDGRFFAHENTRAGQELLRRAIVRRGLPVVLYADNGAPFANAWLNRTCAVLGVRLVHSKPYSPEGRGKQERVNRYIREAFLTEAVPSSASTSFDELNDRFAAWVEQVANRRVHAETGEAPIDRFERRRAAPPSRRRTAAGSVPLVGHPQGDPHRDRPVGRQQLRRRPALVGRRVELRYDPEDLTRIDVLLGRPTGRGRRARSSSAATCIRPSPKPARPEPAADRHRLPGPGRRRPRRRSRHRRQDRLRAARPVRADADDRDEDQP